MTNIRIDAGVINVPNKIGPRKWRECWNILADNTSVFGVNEALRRPQKVVYTALAKTKRWGYFGLWKSPNPVFFDKSEWKFVSGEVVLLHGRGPWYDRYRGYNAERYATVARLRHRETDTEHTFINVHWVSEGRKVPDDWRQKVRKRSIAKVGRLIEREWSAGRIVHLLGDTNIGDPFQFDVSRFRWVRGNGIDKYGVSLPLGVRVVTTNAALRTAPTDHKHGVLVKVNLVDNRRSVGFDRAEGI